MSGVGGDYRISEVNRYDLRVSNEVIKKIESKELELSRRSGRKKEQDRFYGKKRN